MAERERLRELALETLAKLLAEQRRAGDAEGALRTAGRLIALDPLQEPVHRSLMRLYSELGRRGTALQQYQQCERILRRELGVEPEEETVWPPSARIRALFAEAKRHLDRALALAHKHGRRPLLARCHLDLAELEREAGRREDALEHICHATTMFAEMGMRFWLEQAEAERLHLDPV